MRKFSAILASIGYVENVDAPVAVRKYYAYKGGEVFGPFDTDEEAKRVSKITERVTTNQAEIDFFYSERQAHYQKACNMWEYEMEQENIPFIKAHTGLDGERAKKFYDTVYSHAWERGHSSGYDNVNSCFSDEIERAIAYRLI